MGNSKTVTGTKIRNGTGAESHLSKRIDPVSDSRPRPGSNSGPGPPVVFQIDPTCVGSGERRGLAGLTPGSDPEFEPGREDGNRRRNY